MSNKVRIRRLHTIGTREIQGLCDVLIDCVEGGDSIGFLYPMTREKAETYWANAAASALRGERTIVVAMESDDTIIGTVSVAWATPENQPHRAEIAKMLVRRSSRRQGIGALLLAEAECAAAEVNRTVLVLDTASPAAERLYSRSGWQLCGTIPHYALMPDGKPCRTTLFYKELV